MLVQAASAACLAPDPSYSTHPMDIPSDTHPTTAGPGPTAPGLRRGAANTLGEALAARVADRIALGGLAPGARLPSVREGARQHGVSPSTVVACSWS